jgi:hypothetical protein
MMGKLDRSAHFHLRRRDGKVCEIDVGAEESVKSLQAVTRQSEAVLNQAGECRLKAVSG